MSQPTKKQSKDFNGYECGNGPRPPVPGEESQASKMTTEGASKSTSSSNSNRSPESEISFSARVKRWQESFSCLLADNEGVELLLGFVEEEAGIGSINYTRLNFYFAVEGLRLQREEKIIRKLIRRISDEIIRDQIEVTPELRTTITGIVQKKIPPSANVFDELQKQVKETIAATSYQTFLVSDFFIKYVEEQEKKFEAKAVVTATSLASAINNAVAGGAADDAARLTGRTIELSPLLMSSNLQTLHEDTELNLSEKSTLTKTTTDRPMPKLTIGRLLDSQEERLKVRPPGAYGYNVSFNTSFNPVSRQDSERQSCSSASLTDSEVNSKDGKPYLYRRSTPAEDIRRCMNPANASHKTAVKPRTEMAQGLRETVAPVSNEKLEQASQPLDAGLLCHKLNLVLKQIEKNEKQEKFNRSLSDKLSVLPHMEEDDQSILDLHMERVFSPYSTPGNISPKHLNSRYHHRSSEMSTPIPDFVAQAMRHSKSIPEHASTGLLSSSKSKLIPNKWPSTNFDSGVETSLYSANLPYKIKEMKSIEQLPIETMRKSSKDDLRKTRKQMPIPASHQSSFMPTSSSHHTNSLPRIHDDDNYTYAVYTFGDEKIPYRTKIPGKRLTLKHFKDYSPKKGNFRYFFTTVCDDRDSPIIQEEVINDSDLLPLYDGKIMGTLKSDN